MALKAVVDNLDDVDEGLREQYKETTHPETKAKVYVLDLENLAALPDVVRLNTSLRKERDEHKGTKAKLAPFAAFGDPTKLQEQLDRIPELEAAAEGKLDDSKINAIVEGRVKTKLAPLERELGQLRTQVGEKDKVIEGFTAKERSRMIGGALGKAARELKVVDSAMEDVELYGERMFEVQEDGTVVTRDGVGVAPGLSPKAWLEDMQAKRPHWWGPTQGGGAGGSRQPNGGGANPWSADGWNLTEQGNVLKTKGRAEADRLAKAAGTVVGGQRPTAKK